MNIDGKPYRTIWLGADGASVEIIDQTKLPFALEIVSLKTLEDVARAISSMRVRGAPLIGATAAYGVALALQADAWQMLANTATPALAFAALHLTRLSVSRDHGNRRSAAVHISPRGSITKSPSERPERKLWSRQ